MSVSDDYVIVRRGPRNVAVAKTFGNCKKVGFSSKAKARRKMIIWGRRNGCKSIYRCPYCKQWHLTCEQQRTKNE